MPGERFLTYRARGKVHTVPRWVGQYELDEYLDSGQFGDVILARHAKLNDPRAIKLCEEGRLDLDTFLKEARRIADLHRPEPHPNIVQVVDFDLPTSGFPYAFYVMRFVNGKKLSTMFDNGSRAEWEFAQKAKCFHTILKAINYAWQRGAPHYDLHTGNILVRGYPDQLDPVILDFSIDSALLNSVLLKYVTGEVKREDILSRMLHQLEDILQDLFCPEYGFFEAWKANVWRFYGTLEAMTSVSTFLECFNNTRASFQNQNKKIQEIYDEFAKAMRSGDEDLTFVLLLNLSSMKREELTRFFGHPEFPLTGLRHLYSDFAWWFVRSLGIKEGLREYYALLKRYKKRIPPALADSLSFGEIDEFKYPGKDEQYGEEWVGLIAKDLDQNTIIGYSLRRQKMMTFSIEKIQPPRVIRAFPAWSPDELRSDRRRNLDRDKPQEEMTTFWLERSGIYDKHNLKNTIESIAENSNLPASFLEISDYLEKVLWLIKCSIDFFNHILKMLSRLNLYVNLLYEIDKAREICSRLRTLRLRLDKLYRSLPSTHNNKNMRDYYTKQAEDDFKNIPDVNLLDKHTDPLWHGIYDAFVSWKYTRIPHQIYNSLSEDEEFRLFEICCGNLPLLDDDDDLTASYYITLVREPSSTG